MKDSSYPKEENNSSLYVTRLEEELASKNEQIAELRSEVKRLCRRDGNAEIYLAYDNEVNPFCKDKLDIIDVGVADNIYVVESELVSKLQQDNKRLYKWVNDLQGGMYVNCVYCGHRYGTKDEVAESMSEVLKLHVENCPEHPLSKLRQAIENAVRVCDSEESKEFRNFIFAEYDFLCSINKPKGE